MTVRIHLSLACLLSPSLLWPQQANVNLDYNPQKNTENLIPFSATLNSPDVRDDGTVMFRLKAPAAKEVLLSGVAILTALGKSGQSVPFTKGADGVWTLTVGPSGFLRLGFAAGRHPLPARLQPDGELWELEL